MVIIVVVSVVDGVIVEDTDMDLKITKITFNFNDGFCYEKLGPKTIDSLISEPLIVIKSTL